MNDNTFEIDAKCVLNKFAELTGKQQKNVYKNSFRKASRILVSETKQQLKTVVGSKINSKNSWNGKALSSGIKFKINPDATEAKVHIMGDFRLKFFEKGTAVRTLKKNKANRGAMTAHYFFRQAKANKEKEIFDSMDKLISESINRIYNR